MAVGLSIATPVVAQDPLVELHGMLELGVAGRVRADPLQPDDLVLGEARFRLDLSHFTDRAEFFFKGDLTTDAVADDVELDIRQAVVLLRATDWLDVRVGRQVLTWGTGDLLFLNDQFPKDFVSFFIGRDDEFLKAPSNSMKVTAYTGLANVDLVWTPVFEPDRFITGERISFFDTSGGSLVSAKTTGGPLQPLKPAREFENGELAARVFRVVGGYELAAYGYWGFTKQPLAFDPVAERAMYSRQSVYGASVRGGWLGGIANFEGALYDSSDGGGANPNVPNSEVRALLGYERELATDLTAGFQYSLEWVLDHGALLANSRNPRFEPRETTHMLTNRVTYRLMQQTLTLSLFTFVVPADDDAHVRASATKRWSDAMTITVGANVMTGDDSGFFGQLEKASNAFLRIRYGF
ncbi:MAG: hypothetical protein BMS9Abin29_0333 [Gemmatimonadota bacterium]|nr:MAG: hypothetical protein BMS9Abin29_0333 [Gemmatimonadota bacterium]